MRFNHIEYAEFYHKQQVDAGYPGKLLPFVIGEVENFHRVLDVGAGTGFFSIPLAKEGHRVTAVEPSSEMLKIMMKNSSPENLSSIDLYNDTWENWIGECHDAAICVHSLYPMPDVKKAVTMINESAVKKILIVRDSARMKTLSGVVREKLSIPSNRDFNIEIISALNDLSVNWERINIYEERKHPVNDIIHEADSILYQLRLDQSFRKDIINIVEQEISRTPDKLFFNAIYSDNAYIF